ncbi:MAG: hypothetical protein ACX939_02270 [Hyphococcus sp.]
MTNASAHNPPATDKRSWESLYERIRLLALRRSEAMVDAPEGEPDAFDRGARALRTLMGAAEVARRMKREDAREQESHDAGETAPVVSDERIRKVYREIEAAVERIEREDEDGAGDRGSDAAAPSGTGGKALESERP